METCTVVRQMKVILLNKNRLSTDLLATIKHVDELNAPHL
jgi:hypothetical protein